MQAHPLCHVFYANRRRQTHTHTHTRIGTFILRHLPSLYGTTSGFFSSYISSEWLNGNEILSLICRFPGRENFAFECWNFSCCGCLWERSFSATMVPIPMQTRATRMPTKMPIERIGVSSKLFEPWALPLYDVNATVRETERRGEERERERFSKLPYKEKVECHTQKYFNMCMYEY